jgi:hypothetical protein
VEIGRVVRLWQAFGRGWCRAFCDGPDWHGVGYNSLRVYCWVYRRYPEEFRCLNNVEFAVYQEAACLPRLEDRIALVQEAASNGWKQNRVRREAKLRKRAEPVNGTNMCTIYRR